MLGGIGNLRGALLGGLILGVAENYGQILFGTEWRDVVAFVAVGAGADVPAHRHPRRESGEVAGMSDRSTNAVPRRPSGRKAGVGDAIRTWWDGLARPMQWLVGVPAIILLALLPVFPPPFIDTPAPDFGGVMAQFAMYALIAIGLNVVVGQAGLLDLGYVGFYAVGAYTVGLLTSPNSPWNQTDDGWMNEDWAWLACLPIAMVVTAISGLILGTPTLRLRGDYLAIVTLGFGEIVRLLADNLTEVTNGSLGLSGIAYPRARVSPRTQPAGRVLRRQRRRPAQLRRLVVLARHGAGDHGAADRRQPRTQPGRPGVGGDPRGRGRRRDHGRAHIQVQAVGIHDRRGHRRHVRCDVRRTGAVRQPDRASTSSTRCCSCARS